MLKTSLKYLLLTNIHNTYQIKGRNLITEPLPRYACKKGQIVDFSSRGESHKIEVTVGYISSNRVWWLFSLDDWRPDLLGNGVDQHGKVGMQIEVVPLIESAQTETTVTISTSKRVKHQCRFANRRSGSTRSVSHIINFWHTKRGGHYPSIFWICDKLTQPISTLSNPMARSISANKSTTCLISSMKFSNFKPKLKTHRASDRRISWGFLLPTTSSTKPIIQFQSKWLAPTTAVAVRISMTSSSGVASPPPIQQFNPLEHNGSTHFSKNKSENERNKKTHKTKLYGQTIHLSNVPLAKSFPMGSYMCQSDTGWESYAGLKF